MEMENLRENLLDMAELEFPSIFSIKNPYISIEDIVDFVLYEGIKEAYDNYAEKKSIRQHMIENNMDTDADRRRLSRQFQYAQYYRDYQNERLGKLGFYSEELAEKSMEDFNNRITGHLITAMNFQELKNMLDIPILEKIIGLKIGSSKKISNQSFKELMIEYEDYIDNLENSMDTPEEIVYNTELYFTLEWKYSIDLIYDITLEAEKLGYPKFVSESTAFLMGTVNIFPTDWYNGIISTECRMIYKRPDLVPLVFRYGQADSEKFIHDCADLYRIREIFRFINSDKKIYELVVKTTIRDRAEFIKNRQWIWKKRIKEKEWTPDRIRYARKIFDKTYLKHETPSIK